MTHKRNLRKRKKIDYDELSDDSSSLDLSSLEEELVSVLDNNKSLKRIKRKVNELDTFDKERNKRIKITSVEESSDDSSSEGSSSTEDSFIDEDELEDKGEQILLDIISDNIRSVYPNLPRKELNRHISKAMDKARSDLVLDNILDSDYQPDEWKKSLKKDEIKELQPVLDKLQKIIKSRKPTIQKILRACIPENDKIDALQLFFIWQNNTIEDTQDHIDVANRINRILDMKKEIKTQEVLVKIEEREKRILKRIGNTDRALGIKILNLDAEESTISRIYEMYLKYKSLNSGSDEKINLKQKLSWAVSLPYRKHKLPEIQMQNKSSFEVNRYCSEIYKKLNSKLFGMKKIKERLIQIVNNRIYQPKTRALLALKGIPGVGKTAIAKALAESLDLPFERISLGGMADSSEFTGSNNVWVGSTPSVLIRILKKMKYSNGIVLFDEIDKLKRKEIQYALLQITDYIQNSNFQDMYLSEFTHDLSSIWFMFAMNDDSFLDSALKDRLDIITVEKYTHKEIVEIILGFLFPKALKDVGIPDDVCTLTRRACSELIFLLENKMKENGLRSIDKELHQIASRMNMLKTRLGEKEPLFPLSYSLVNFKGFPYTITRSDIHVLWSNPKTNMSYMDMYS